MSPATATTLANPASVENSGSATTAYPGGDVLQANAYIDSVADSNGCGHFATSAKLLGNNPPNAAWIKNTVTFHANGIGAAISGGSVSANGADASASWQNNNAWIADLSGTICVNWATWYLSVGSTATSFVPQYGSPRIASVTL